jgi:histidinol dehydrogenase
MIRVFEHPPEADWEAICLRPEIKVQQCLATVTAILQEVKTRGDQALSDFALRWDNVLPLSLRVSASDIAAAATCVAPQLQKAILIAAGNIKRFHESQLQSEPVVETMPGVTCWRKSVPIDTIGIYVPGGSAPLFSTILMLAIPARIAGCRRIVMCTPPDKNGKVPPQLLFAAQCCGIEEIYCLGGAQAIAAMAYGTETVPRVSKIFGPGNNFVTTAKVMVQQDGIAIDLPAGPSELMIIADQTADASFVAADLLSQAEHGVGSQVVLLTTDKSLPGKVRAELLEQMRDMPRSLTAMAALHHSSIVVLDTVETCFRFANQYAPEHLILAIDQPLMHCDAIRNAGSVFIGNYSCESMGDYASGPNHTLPTNRSAMAYSGVSVESFLRKISFQEVSEDGLRRLGPTVEIMAEAEQLKGHKNAVTIRLKKLRNEN